MKYFLNYQKISKGSVRPEDLGDTHGFDIQSHAYALIPSVGDYVDVQTMKKDVPTLDGKVKSRLFRYLADTCLVNIVLEETEDAEWGALIKE